MFKILLTLLILLSFSVIIVLPNFSNVCVTDGGNFGIACNNSVYLNGTVIKHIGEKLQFLNIIVRPQASIVLAIALIFFLIIQKYLENKESIVARLYAKRKFFNLFIAKLFNYLVRAFSSGLIHPKIY